MPLDPLPGKLVLPSRDQERDAWIRDYSLRNPNAQTGQGTLPYFEGATYADATAVHRSNAVTIANGVSRATATGPALDDWATAEGTIRQPPVGGSGFVIISASSGGATIVNGMILTGPNGYRAQFTCPTGTYFSGAQVAMAGITTGPSTNLAAGTVLQIQSPTVGLGPSATVAQQADGSGLSGGNDQENDAQLLARLDFLAANPPASGNDAQYQSLIMTTPGLAVQQGFTFPAVIGPGSKGCTLTLRPSVPGGNRIPNTAQLAMMAAFLTGNMPADDSILQVSITGYPVVVALALRWSAGASNWADATQFPLYHAGNLVNAVANAGGALTPTAFRLTSAAMTEVPVVGQSVGFLDIASSVFRRKKILTVTVISGTAYDVTIDTTAGISDTSYTPVSGQACCPWSDSLSSLVIPVASYFDTLGPGEQYATFFDPGLRQRRSPFSPGLWPSVFNNRVLGGQLVPQPPQGPQQNQPAVQTLLTLPTLQDVLVLAPTIPTAPPTGTPGVNSYMITLGNLVAFPE